MLALAVIYLYDEKYRNCGKNVGQKTPSKNANVNKPKMPGKVNQLYSNVKVHEV